MIIHKSIWAREVWTTFYYSWGYFILDSTVSILGEHCNVKRDSWTSVKFPAGLKQEIMKCTLKNISWLELSYKESLFSDPAGIQLMYYLDSVFIVENKNWFLSLIFRERYFLKNLAPSAAFLNPGISFSLFYFISISKYFRASKVYQSKNETIWRH